MSPAPQRPRLEFEQWPAAVYAIGDVHGCIEQLLDLEAAIVADGAGIEGEKWIVTLGDYVDRGSHAPRVIDHVRSSPPAGFRRVALIGNHEQLMLDFLDNPAANLNWLEWGGLFTAAAYGLTAHGEDWRRQPLEFARALRPLVPEAHIDFLQTLPTCLKLPGFLFVHAGIRPGLPLAMQQDEDLIWIRAPFLSAKFGPGLTVVHGHTPVDAVAFAPGRVDIDTGCFFSGVLTALRVLPGGETKVLQARGPVSDYVPSNRRG